MPKKQSRSSSQTSIHVGEVSSVSGSVNIAGGDITTNRTTGLSAAEFEQLFDHIYAAVDVRPETPSGNKEDLKREVNAIQSTVTEAVQGNRKVDEDFIAYHFRNIARMAPDILDVIVATLANPLMGLGVAAAKIRDKAVEETRKT